MFLDLYVFGSYVLRFLSSSILETPNGTRVHAAHGAQSPEILGSCILRFLLRPIVLWRIHGAHSPDGNVWSATRRDLQFLSSLFLTFLPQTLCSTTVNGTTRLLRTYQSRHLAVFLSCMQTSVLCHFSMDYVRLSHFSSVKLFHFHVLVTDETLVFVEES